MHNVGPVEKLKGEINRSVYMKLWRQQFLKVEMISSGGEVKNKDHTESLGNGKTEGLMFEVIKAGLSKGD